MPVAASATVGSGAADAKALQAQRKKASREVSMRDIHPCSISAIGKRRGSAVPPAMQNGEEPLLFAVFYLLNPDLQNLNVVRLPALGALHNVKLHGLAFLQRAKAIRLDGGVVNENILTTLAAQKSKALRIVKPLYCSLFHDSCSLLLLVLVYRSCQFGDCCE
jgi:hypothetical protein